MKNSKRTRRRGTVNKISFLSLLAIDASEDPIFLGLKKKTKCRLCEQEFQGVDLPGVISFKSVLELRKL